MSIDKFKIEIINLIESKREGDYWDFKQKHHKNKDDLLHDIICMANNRSDKDGYIIFGVEDKTFNIVGVSQDENRKNQQQVIDFLKDKKFVSGIRPTVELKTLEIKGQEIDVLIIKNTTDTPYYLVESFQNIRANYIYTRIGDTNTPKDRSADINHVEYLWKKRFLLTRPQLEQIQNKLKYKEEWKEEGYTYYNIYNSEYKICIIYEDDEYEGYKPEFYAYNMYNSSVIYKNLEIKYYETKLYSKQLVVLDGGRLTIPTPEWKFLRFEENNLEPNYCLKYFTKDSLDYKLLKFLFDDNNHEECYAYRKLCEVILIFENELEKESFFSYIEEHKDTLVRLIKEDTAKYNYLEIESEREKEVVIERLKTGKALNIMLKEFRKIYYK